jgi:5'-3' exonuclease
MQTLVVDASYLLHSTFHTRVAELTNGVLYGSLRSLLAKVRETGAERTVVCFDVGGIDTLYRKSMLGTPSSARYKENRRVRTGAMTSESASHSPDDDEFGGSPDDDEPVVDPRDDFRRQREMFRRVVAEMGFECVWAPGYEADDCIAWVVHANRLNDVHVVANDSDLYQLLDENVTVGDVDLWDFQQRYLCKPDVWPMVKAIAGDSSDNVQGVPGIGIKTAVKYLRGTAPTSIERLIESYDTLVADNLALVRLPFPGVEEAIQRVHNTVGVLGVSDVAEKYGMRSLK